MVDRTLVVFPKSLWMQVKYVMGRRRIQWERAEWTYPNPKLGILGMMDRNHGVFLIRLGDSVVTRAILKFLIRSESMGIFMTQRSTTTISDITRMVTRMGIGLGIWYMTILVTDLTPTITLGILLSTTTLYIRMETTGSSHLSGVPMFRFKEMRFMIVMLVSSYTGVAIDQLLRTTTFMTIVMLE